MSDNIIKNLISVIAVTVAFLLQTAVLPACGVRSIAPELILAMLVIITLQGSHLCAGILAAVFGILMDVLFTTGIGLYSLAYVLTVCLSVWLSIRFSDHNLVVFVILVCCAMLIRGTLFSFIIFFKRLPLSFTGASILRSGIRLVLTEAISLPLYLLISWWFDQYNEKGRIEFK